MAQSKKLLTMVFFWYFLAASQRYYSGIVGPFIHKEECLEVSKWFSPTNTHSSQCWEGPLLMFPQFPLKGEKSD